MVEIGGRAAGVGRKELDLAAHDAARLVHLINCELGGGELRRPEQRGRAALRIEQADLEVVSRSTRSDQAGGKAERDAPHGATEEVAARTRQYLLCHEGSL